MTWDKYTVGFVFGLALGAYLGESPKQEVKQDAVPAKGNSDQGLYDRFHSVIEEVSRKG